MGLFMVMATTAFNISITLAESTEKAPKIKSGKSGKSGKTGNSGKSGSSLVAIVESTDPLTAPIGTATIHSNPNGSFLFQLDMENLDQGCTPPRDQCSVSIQEGTDCSNFGTGYYIGTDFGLNWKNSGQYYTFGEGSTRSAFTINTSVDFADNKGHVVVVKDSQGISTGCGILKTPTKQKVLTASIGLKPNCESCGIHIHAGKSCADPALVLGHFWNQYVVTDLWTIAGGAYYMADQDGRTDSSFNLFTGYGYEANTNHAVVIHTASGARVGCGILQ